MLRALFLAAVGVFGMAIPAMAQQWRAVVDNDQHPLTVMFLDAATLVRDKDLATGQVLIVMEDDPKSQRDWSYSIVSRKIDCASNRSQILSSRFFRDDKVLGSVSKEGEWVPVRQGSMLESVAGVMCGRQDYMTPVIENPVALAETYFAEAGKAGGKKKK